MWSITQHHGWTDVASLLQHLALLSSWPVTFLLGHWGRKRERAPTCFSHTNRATAHTSQRLAGRLSIISEIVFSSLAPSCLPEDSPGRGRRGRRAQVKDSGSGSLECTGSSKEGKVALKFCLFTADCNLLRAQATEEPSSACVLTLISKKIHAQLQPP